MALKSSSENVVSDCPSSLDEGFNVFPISRSDQLSDEADYCDEPLFTVATISL